MKKLIKNNSYDIYLIFLGTLAFFSFTGALEEYILLLFVGITLLAVVAKKSVFYILPAAFFLTMSLPAFRNDIMTITLFAFIWIFLLVFDGVRNRTFKKLGELFPPLVVIILLSILTSINAPDNFVTAIGFILALAMCGLYIYFVNTIEPDEDNFIRISKMFMYLAALVSVQMLFQVFDQDEPMVFIQRRRINLEWENLNIIIYVNLIAIPFIGYLITKTKVKLPYMSMMLLAISGIVLTLSRSSMLTVGVYALFLIPTIYFFDPYKKHLSIQGGIFTLFLVIGFFSMERVDILTDILNAITSREWMNTENRTELLVIALEQFKLHPIIGSGGLYSSDYYLKEIGPHTYHNIFAQISTLGVLGFAAVGYLFVLKTKVIMLSKSSFKWFVLLMIFITAFVNGMFQPMYFYTTYMIYILMVLALVEVNIKEEK